MLLKATKQELHEVVAVENALLGQVVDKSPIFRGFRHLSIEHRIRIEIPGIKIKLTHHIHLLSGPGAHLDYTGPGKKGKGDSGKMNEELRAATAAVIELQRRALCNKRAAGNPRHPGKAQPGLEEPYLEADREARVLTLVLKYLEKEAWRQQSREVKRTAVKLADRALDIAICFGLLGLATLGIAAVCVTLNAPDIVTQATALVGVGTALGRAVTRK